MNELDASIWSKGYDLVVPFRVPLADGRSLICEEVVRAMPGRRYVCRGKLGDQGVFVKLYEMGNWFSQAKHEWNSEQQGISAMHSAGIPAPEILHSEASASLSTRLVIFAELTEAESARQRWEEGNELKRKVLIRQLVELLSRHHDVGIRQTDCHLLNFVFSKGILYTLDAADIVKSTSALSRKVSMQSLADLLGLFPVEYDSMLPSLYEYYWQRRSEKSVKSELKALISSVRKVRRYKLRKYLDKTYRTCSAYIANKNWRKYSVYNRQLSTDLLESLVNNPDVESEQLKRTVIKDGNTCTVSLIETQQEKIVCKRYNIKNTGHGVMRAFRTSRASRSWRNAHCLRAFNIHTPLPLALVEQRFGPIRRRAWLFMQYIDGVSAYHVFRDSDKTEQQIAQAVSQFVNVFSKMVLEQLSHGDMKSTNFIFSENHLYVIDLDAMQVHNSQVDFALAFRKDMQRFFRNWQELPEVAALFREQLAASPVAAYLPEIIND